MLHRFRYSVRGLSIYAGSRHNSRAGIRLTVQSVAVHKLYDEIISDYDIAIIKVYELH